MKSKTDNSNGVLTNGDLDKIANLLDAQFDNRIKPFVKDELNSGLLSLETKLKKHIDEGVETVMDGMDSIYEELKGTQVVKNHS